MCSKWLFKLSKIPPYLDGSITQKALHRTAREILGKQRQIQTDRNQTDWNHIDFFTLTQLREWMAQRPLTLTKKMHPHANWGICVRCLPSPHVARPAFRGGGTLQKSRLYLSWSSEDSWVSGADIPRFRFQLPYMLFAKVKSLGSTYEIKQQ